MSARVVLKFCALFTLDRIAARPINSGKKKIIYESKSRAITLAMSNCDASVNGFQAHKFSVRSPSRFFTSASQWLARACQDILKSFCELKTSSFPDPNHVSAMLARKE